MTVIRPGKGEKQTISKGKRGYRVTPKQPKKSPAEKWDNRMAKKAKKFDRDVLGLK